MQTTPRRLRAPEATIATDDVHLARYRAILAALGVSQAQWFRTAVDKQYKLLLRAGRIKPEEQ